MAAVEYFLRYKGQCYDVGTKLKFSFYGTIQEGVIEWFSHNHLYIRLIDGSGLLLSKVWSLDNTIIEIIEPVQYVELPQKAVKGGASPSYDDAFYGGIFYVIVMVVGVIFEARWLIWISATVIFFLWKNGFFNKKQ